MTEPQLPTTAARPRIRLLAADIDGTLAPHGGQPSARTVAALRRARAHSLAVVLATARPPRFVRPLRDQLASASLAICSNGAAVYDLATDRVIAERGIAPDVAACVVHRLRARLPGVTFAIEAGMDFAHEPAYRPSSPAPADTPADAVERLLTRPVSKLLVQHPECGDHGLLQAAEAATAGIATIHRAERHDVVEIAANGVSKGTALERLARELDIDPAEVLAFGDMPNDIPMLAWAGHAVAVGDAHPDVLAIAAHVTGPCTDDGVAAHIEHLLSRHQSRHPATNRQDP